MAADKRQLWQLWQLWRRDRDALRVVKRFKALLRQRFHFDAA